VLPIFHLCLCERSLARDTPVDGFLASHKASIQGELGDQDEKTDEILRFREQIEQAGMPPAVEQEAFKQLRRLEAKDSNAGAVVRLRFLAGLSVEETARALGLSPRSVAREWAYARARLFQFLKEAGL